MKQIEFTGIDLTALRADALAAWERGGPFSKFALENLLYAYEFRDEGLVGYAAVVRPKTLLGFNEVWFMPGKAFSSKHVRGLRRALAEITDRVAPFLAVAAPEFDRFTRLFGFQPVGSTPLGTLYEARQ